MSRSRPVLLSRLSIARGLACCIGVLLGCALLAPTTTLAADAVREVYLIQNSGWMEPFYLDPRSPFMPLLNAFIQASAVPDARITIASFNQAGQLGDVPSPLPLYTGAMTPAAVAASLGKLTLPRRADGRYTDADYNGALSETIPRLLSGAPGVIWMVTNNKNSRSNDQHVIENTSRFSTLLTGSGFISAVIAYPLRLPARGPLFSERGLVIYGIAYGAEAAAWLQQAATSPAMQHLLVAKPVRLKPLTLDPLRLTLAGAGTRGIHLGVSGGAIEVDGVSGSKATQIDIPGKLTSDYYPQVIEQAQLQAQWISAEGMPPVAVSISPGAIVGMGPDDTLDDVHVVLNIPPIARPPGLAGLLQGGRQLHGMLRLQLTGVHLGLQPAFVSKMSDLFDTDAERVGGQVMQLGARQSDLPAALPAVFLGHEAVGSATTDVPVVLGVVFSAWPLILLIGAVGAMLLLCLGVLVACSRERRYAIPVGGDLVDVSLRPFRSARLASRAGVRVMVTARLIGQPKVVLIA